MKKTARKTEPEEWNQKEIKAYKFGTLEDALYYALTGGIKYYDQNYFKNPDLIKLTPVESGALGLAVVGDNKQKAILYDSNKKMIKKLPLSYVKAQVNAGETYYIEFPKNCKEGLITAYVLQNECGGLAKNDLNMQKGEEKETYHTFKMTKRGFAGFVVASMVEDGGNTSYKVQKNEKGKCAQHIAVVGNGDIAAVGFSAACGCENAVAALHLHLCGNAHRRGARVSARGATQTDVQPARAPSFHDGVLVGDVLCGFGAVSFLRPIPQHVARISDGRCRGAGLRIVYD